MTTENTDSDERNAVKKPAPLALFDKAAKQDLIDMANQGMADNYQKKCEFSGRRWGGYQKAYGDVFIFSLMPKSMTDSRDSERSSGLFKGLGFSEIIKICFEDDAFEFILRYSYNDYLFWFLVYQVLLTPEDEPQLPYKLEYVKQQLFCAESPYMVVGVRLSDGIVEKLKAAAASMHGMIDGSQIDVDKLDVRLASYLKGLSLVLDLSSTDNDGVPNLLLNPMLTELIQKLNAPDNQPAAGDAQ